jgi:hypothetical protein
LRAKLAIEAIINPEGFIRLITAQLKEEARKAHLPKNKATPKGN